MSFHKTKLATAIMLMIAGTTTAMAANQGNNKLVPVDQMPMIEKSPDGFFVAPPLADNMLVMIVSVYNTAGEQVLKVRSKGEPVELLSAGLPAGDYMYQVKTYYQLDEQRLINGEMQDKAMIRDAGRFSIKNNQMLQPAPEFSEDLSFLDSVIDASLSVAGGVFNTLVSSASAANLVASSSIPTVTYDDTTSSSAAEFSTRVSAAADDSSGSWILRDEVGFASPVNHVITINTVENSAITDSWVVESNGSMSWKNGRMFLGSGYLSLGALNPANDFSITATQPDIQLKDDGANEFVEWELFGGNFYFITDPDTTVAGTSIPFKVSLSAQTDALVVESNSNVTVNQNLTVEKAITSNTGQLVANSSSTVASTWLINSVNNAFLQMINNDFQLQTFFDPDVPLSIDMTSPDDSLRIDSAGRVGLGTGTPSEALHIQRTDSAARIQLDSISNAATNAPQMIWRRARSNTGTPAALLTGDNLGAFSFRGYDGTGYSGSRGFINVQASQNWSGTGHGTQMLFQVTQNNTTAPFAAMQILNDGTVVINGSVLNVPDYVFEEDYDLMSLDQLADYLKVNKHLPGVASAKDVNENGLDLGGSQLSLLEKVEELTLYTLQQHEDLKQMDSLKAENAQLKAAHRQLLTAFHAQQEKLDKVDQLEQMVNQLMESQEGKSIYTSLK